MGTFSWQFSKSHISRFSFHVFRVTKYPFFQHLFYLIRFIYIIRVHSPSQKAFLGFAHYNFSHIDAYIYNFCTTAMYFFGQPMEISSLGLSMQ